MSRVIYNQVDTDAQLVQRLCQVYGRISLASDDPQLLCESATHSLATKLMCKSLYFAYKAYQIEKPSAYRQREMAEQSTYAPETPHFEEKPEVQHIA